VTSKRDTGLWIPEHERRRSIVAALSDRACA
jgi:hypothetical protein